MLQDSDVQLPGTITRAVRQQLALSFLPPYEAPITVAVNGALMSSAWFFLPTSLRDKLFTLHGTLAFALVLAGWMYSDVPSTNVLGPDARRIPAALGDPVMFRRLLFAKNAVLWLMVTPVCALVALISGLVNHSLLATCYTIVIIAVFPFGFLAISAWTGILFPYHPMPLRVRWEHRKPWKRMLVRWGVLVVTPYVLVPGLAVLLLTPSLLVWGFTAPHGLTEMLPDSEFGLGVAVACAITIVCAWGGHRMSGWLAQRRRAQLLEFLSDPVRG